jgi:hypothetical protein
MGDADESYDFSDIDRFVKKFREGFELDTGCRLPRGGGKILPGAMPMRTCGGKWEIVQRLAINDLSRVNIVALVAELKEESRELAN